MALVVNDRVKETTAVVGTGIATLLGAALGFQSFAVIGNGNTTYYCISDQGGANWEVGIGTYSSSGNTLARTTVLASSNAGALVVFTTGVKDVFVTYPSEKGVWYDASGNVLFTGTTTTANLAYTGTLTGSTGILNIGSGQLYKDASGNVGIGTSSPASRLDIGTGNLNFSGTAQRITGDFSNVTTTSVAFQSSVTNGSTQLAVIANGTSTNAGINFYSNSADITNSSRGLIRIDTLGPDFKIDSQKTGTGTYLPITFYTSGSEKVRIDTSGNVGIGTSSPGAKLDLIGTQWFRGALNTGAIGVLTADATSGANGISISASFATGGYGPIVFNTSATERMRIDSSGNVGIGTSSPTKQLSVYTSANSLQIQSVVRNANTGTGIAAIGFNVADLSEGDYTQAGIGLLRGSANGSGSLCFYNKGSGTASNFTTADEKMRIDSSGNLLVGATTSNSGKVTIITTGNASASMAQTGTTGDHIYFRTSTNTLAGYITSPTGTTVSYISVSDQRLKENIVDAPSALASINAIKVRSFDWKVDGIHQDYGYIAQELLEVAPEAVAVPENEDEMMGVDFGKLTPRLVKAIQELKTIIDTQQEQINSLLEK